MMVSDLFDNIQEAKNRMGDNAANIIAELSGLEQFDEEHLKSLCPFHEEKTGSFMWNKKEHFFHCFGCGRNFGILDLYTQLEGSYKKALKRLFEEVGIEYDLKTYAPNKQDRNDYLKNYIYPKEETNTDRSKVEEYLGKRGISKATLDYMGVKQDSQGNIVYELRDLDDTLLAVKYRPSRAVKKGETKMWWQPKTSNCPLLYNINKIDITKPLVLTEGYQDALACVEAGYTNVCSIHGGANDLGWVEFNYDFLENFEDIRLWFDNDSAGEEGLKNTINRLGEYRCRIIKRDSDIEDKVESYYKGFSDALTIRKTDANNILLACGKDQILQLIENAEEVPLDDVIDLMTVEEFDIEKVKYNPTGISLLDKKIYGYINGSVNIWTGYTSLGKTTLVSQSCVLENADRGESVFWFNGESVNSQMLNWILAQAAGRDHTVEFTTPQGFKFYKPTLQAMAKIKETYKGRILVYDNLLLTNPDAILSKMKDLYKRRGTKTFVLDNWMCLNFKSTTDVELVGVQVEFMNNLIHFAKRNDVSIDLICHPRKPNMLMPITEYDVLGSSNIVNLADRIFALEKKTLAKGEPEKYDRHITMLKDRILGEKGLSVGLHYDKATRRLFCDEDDKYKKYNWDDGSIKYSSNRFGENGLLVGKRKLACDVVEQDCDQM